MDIKFLLDYSYYEIVKFVSKVLLVISFILAELIIFVPLFMIFFNIFFGTNFPFFSFYKISILGTFITFFVLSSIFTTISLFLYVSVYESNKQNKKLSKQK